MKRISEQAAAISSLQIDKEDLKQENEKLKLTLDKYMQNFVCFVNNMNKTIVLEEENVKLKEKLEQVMNVREYYYTQHTYNLNRKVVIKL